MTHRDHRKQKGVALWMLLVAVIMVGGFAFYRTANTQLNHVQQDIKLAAAMAKAKEALIARAVTDDNRPGSLPCPDLITNSPGLNNIPGDGKADMFTMTQCPSYVGWLPWVTLDLPELSDGSGTRLWYVLAPTLRDDDSAHPINSDTAMGLQVDGNNDIAALIIAPGPSLSGQTRPSNNPADYLDEENSNGDDRKYVTGPASATFNDVVLIVTRQELMAAVEKRVANEVKSCLEQHAASSANTDHRYPWPAPLSGTNRQGKNASLFGRVPSTQPGSGLDAALKASIAKLTDGQNLIATAPGATQQLAALKTLSDSIMQARNLFDAIFSVANKLKQTADDTYNQLHNLETAINNAALNNRISRSDGNTIRLLAGTSAAAFSSLPDQLVEIGIDVFPWELARRNATLGTAGSTASALVTSTQAVQALLAATTTPRMDINPALTAAINAANTANNAAITAAQTPGDALLLAAARTATNTLMAQNSALLASVEASRVNILASDVSDYTTPLASANLALRNVTGPESAAALLAALNATKTAINGISTGVPGIISAKASTLTAVNAASAALQVSLPNYPLADSNTAAAISNITALAAAIASNEAVDNNVSHSSLNALILTYNTARTAFTAQDTASERPLQSAIVPYAQTLGNAAVNIEIWAKSISDNAAILAPLAKANTVTSNVDPAKAATLNTSAYKVADDALASITGKNAASDLLQTYINTSNASNQAKTIAALATTTGLVNTLIGLANTLDNSLSSTTASALPIIWLSSRCDFLQVNQATWWSNNQWANSVFYQITSPLNTVPGKLTVNGAGSYRLVTLVAGRALATQNRSTATVDNFLEGLNADISRNGNATNPVGSFAALPPSNIFNDRLAY